MQLQAHVFLVRILVEVVDAIRVQLGGATLDAVDFVSLLEQELSMGTTNRSAVPVHCSKHWSCASLLRVGAAVSASSRVLPPLEECRELVSTEHQLPSLLLLRDVLATPRF